MTRSYSRALVDEAGGCHLSVTEPSWQGPSTLFRRAGLFSPAVTGSVGFRFQGDSFADGYGFAVVGVGPRSFGVESMPRQTRSAPSPKARGMGGGVKRSIAGLGTPSPQPSPQPKSGL